MIYCTGGEYANHYTTDEFIDKKNIIIISYDSNLQSAMVHHKWLTCYGVFTLVKFFLQISFNLYLYSCLIKFKIQSSKFFIPIKGP
jgi:hypothetical protein